MATSNAVAKLKALMETQTVVKKTFSMGDGFKVTCKEAKPYQNENGLCLPVVGITSKYVPKYDSYYTMFYLESGETVGCFAVAATEFAKILYTLAGIELHEYARLDMNKAMMVQVCEKPFEKEVTQPDGTTKTETWGTYTFEIVGGDADKFRIVKSVEDYANILGAEDSFTALPETTTPTVEEEAAAEEPAEKAEEKPAKKSK